MTFEVGPDENHPTIQNDGMQYDGLRFRAECKLAGKLYVQPFGVYVAFGEPILGEPEVVVAENVLAFAGIAPTMLRLYPIETHIAEKLHAYTMPRRRPNSRVKMVVMTGLTAQHYVDAHQDLREPLGRKHAHALNQIAAVHRKELQGVGDRILRQTRHLGLQQRVPRRVSPREVARERDTEHGR